MAIYLNQQNWDVYNARRLAEEARSWAPRSEHPEAVQRTADSYDRYAQARSEDYSGYKKSDFRW